MFELVKYIFEDSVSLENVKFLKEDGGNVIIDLFCLETFKPTPGNPARVRIREVLGQLFVIIEGIYIWVWSPKKNEWIPGYALLEELEDQVSM